MHPLFYRKTFRTGFCAGLLVFAALLRLALVPGLPRRVVLAAKRALGSRALFEAALFLETGVRADAGGLRGTGEAGSTGAAPQGLTGAAPQGPASTASDPPSPGLTEDGEKASTWETGDESSGAGRPEAFRAEEAEAIGLRGNCGYAVDKAALLLEPLGWEKLEGPQVLIIHTHSCESYTPSEGYEYEVSGDFRTLDKSASVIAVGDRLAAELEARGVGVIHDTSYNDYPSYNSSYAVAREKIQGYLAEHPSIRIVIDLHRDAMEVPVREATELDGQAVAKLMLVVGTDEGGLYHPDWARNLSCALKLQALTNRSAPGLCKDLSFRRERFNGDLCPGEMIVEVGSTGNTLPEALAAAPYLARSIAELLEVE